MQPHLSVEQRQLALRLRARGWSLREIGPQVDCAFQTVARIAGRCPRRPKPPKLACPQLAAQVTG